MLEAQGVLLFGKVHRAPTISAAGNLIAHNPTATITTIVRKDANWHVKQEGLDGYHRWQLPAQVRTLLDLYQLGKSLGGLGTGWVSWWCNLLGGHWLVGVVGYGCNGVGAVVVML